MSNESKLIKHTTVTQAFSPQECQRLINRVKAVGLTPGPSYRAGSDEPLYDPNSRVANSVTLDREQFKDIYEKVSSIVMGVNAENYQFDLDGPVTLYVVHYPPGGFIKSHGDALSNMTEKRKLTISVQLSKPNDYIGGELMLYHPVVEASRKQGDMTLFPSIRFHEVMFMKNGDRYALIGWFEGTRAFR